LPVFTTDGDRKFAARYRYEPPRGSNRDGGGDERRPSEGAGIPAEEKANFGKEVKTAVREMWGLEYEVDGLQSQFSESIGAMDLDNMDVDFIEDMMLKSKPLQSVLNNIRNRQMAKLEDIKKKYGPAIMDLEIMVVPRPAKRPDETEAEPEKVGGEAAAGEAAPAEAAAGEAAPPAAETEAPAETPAAEAEPTPA